MEPEPDDAGAESPPAGSAATGFGADLLSAASSETEAHSMTVTVADPRVSATRKKMGWTKSTSARSLPCPLLRRWLQPRCARRAALARSPAPCARLPAAPCARPPPADARRPQSYTR